MKLLSASIAISFLIVASAFAQSNPKRDACLMEAQAKGLYTTGSRNPARFNEATAPQRKEFMTECLRRK